MNYTKETLDGLGRALNEAELLGAEFDFEKEFLACTFNPIVVDENGKVPTDRRIQLILRNVNRIASSLRNSDWNDDKQQAEKFELADLLIIVNSFGGLPIYGWEFFNCAEEDFKRWENRLSFDWENKKYDGKEHTFDFFQEGHERHLDIRVWCSEIHLFNPNRQKIDLHEFMKASDRGWNAMNSNPEISKRYGIQFIDKDTKLDI